MIRILKYFKPYLGSVLLVIALLFVQANADLSLPDYMSRIVNVGIQQGGVPDAAPRAIRQDSLERAALFMDTVQRDAAFSAYRLVAPADPGYGALEKDYGRLGEKPVYVLDLPAGMRREDLSAALAPALSALASVEAMAADPAKAAAMFPGTGGQPGPGLSRLPPGTDFFSALAALPTERADAALAGIRSKFAALDPMLVGQMGIRAAKAEYEALGLDMEKEQTAYILSVGGMMLLLTLLSVAATVMVGLLGARTAAGLARDLRSRLFGKVEGFSLAEFDRFSTASLITRSTNDITQVQMVTIMGLRMVFYAPIIGIGGVLRATAKASSMWWIIALAVSILTAIILVVFLVALPKFKSIQKLLDRLNLVVRENLSGMMVIRAFNRQERETARFERANKDLTATMLFVTRVMVVLMPLMMLILNLVSLLIIWTGSREVAASQIRVGDMMAFMQYAMQIFFAFIMMSMMFIMLPRASVSAGRIADVLETEPTILDPEAPRSFPDGAPGRVEFRDVSFRYPGSAEDVLHRISFAAEPGKTTAIIGTTGAGKSTLVGLIPRFYDRAEGSVLVDGIDVMEVSQSELRSRIGFVPQKASLFTGTIESNMLYADEGASAERVARALEVAQAMEFVKSSPEGAGAAISQGGGNVSGGQRQRLTIARALVKNASIYVFDDSFSALDYRTDMNLRRALGEFLGDKTVILVTQRVATIMQADQIVVLDEGRMVGLGTHRELMASCDVYRDIALSQLKEEELS